MSAVDVSEWQKKILAFLYRHLLVKIFPSEADRRQYLISPPGTPDRRGIWFEAFTDPSIIGSPNYERLEKLGDAVAHASLTKILLIQFPDAEPGDLDGIVSYYTSNIVFADVIKRLLPDIPGLIRIMPGIIINDGVIADIFEAMMGAIYLIAELITPGLGHMIATKLFKALLDEWLIATTGDTLFDSRYMRGDIKTQVREIFTRMGCRAPENNPPIMSDDFSTITIEVPLTKYHTDFLDRQGKYIRPRTFVAEGPSKGLAIRRAYDKVFQYLSENDITTEWAAIIKSKNDFLAIKKSDPEAYEIVQRKFREGGYDQISFQKIGKHTIEGQQTVMVLKGRRSDNGLFDDLEVAVGLAHLVNGILIRKYAGLPPLITKKEEPARSTRPTRPANNDFV